jgi:glyoxylase-like metal-dependent hydrolase (beta-lactamase superfamily II)/rhodanese-related sulfurtransferase
LPDPLEIDAETLQNWLADGEPVEVIDIRPRADYETWHIPGAANVDAYHHIYAGSPGPLADFQPQTGAPVVAVCFVGQTSRIAAQYLRSRGVRAVSLNGGMQSWSLSWNTAPVPLPPDGPTVIQVRRTGKGCLSYVIGSAGEALVVDPSLEPEIYSELAAANGWNIRKVLDTHIHADHLSRGLALARSEGAEYFLPAQERVRFQFQPVHPGDQIGAGSSRLLAIATPGHTFESTSFLLDDQALFTGDTLFLESVGRPDLNAGAAETEARTRLLHRSLQELAGMDPDLLVLPCHTGQPVPFDHKAIAASLGEVVEKVQASSLAEDQFVTWILGRIPPNPPNYSTIVQLNERGALPAIDPTALEAGANRCAI